MKVNPNDTLEMKSVNSIVELLNEHRLFFSSQKTKNIAFRISSLKKLKDAILKYEDKLLAALWIDLHKSNEEAYLTEISIVVQELNLHIKHLKKWAKPKSVITPIYLFPSRSKIWQEPLGVSLIIAPWNYPFQLLINPLVGAISAGCCAVLKPSPNTPNVALVMEELIKETFDSNYISVIQGGREINTLLLEQRFDVIFFTGSPALGKVVMKAAAAYLTPVILELGGKSPCLVDEDANLAVAAKRIIWGKTINAGQTCIAPDYLLVHEKVKEELLTLLKQTIEQMFGTTIQQSKFYPRIVNEQAFLRLTNLMCEGNIRIGGETDAKDKFIAPTVIDEIKPEFMIMKEEIFGPILPVLTFSNLAKAIDFVNANEKPLAIYYFGNTETATRLFNKTSSGGGCINDTLMHVTNHHLPFGGVGNSGQGKYHGKGSFLAFSNQRGVVTTPTWIDLPFKYAPFKYFKWMQKFL
ncbi:aldehyde dehydrogenase (NAD+) [Pedobacter sp. CG_S7]|uniref:aldehyde dehydrogenase n=1 Tax=Pedobacter sp. CG_S7 TaxID=3143930 RepID=UPI003398E969